MRAGRTDGRRQVVFRAEELVARPQSAVRWLPLRFLGALLMIATTLVLGAQLRKLDGTPFGCLPDRFEMITALRDPTAADIPPAALTGAADATTVGRAPSSTPHMNERDLPHIVELKLPGRDQKLISGCCDKDGGCVLPNEMANRSAGVKFMGLHDEPPQARDYPAYETCATFLTLSNWRCRKVALVPSSMPCTHSTATTALKVAAEHGNSAMSKSLSAGALLI
jgi:hypothetical protein